MKTKSVVKIFLDIFMTIVFLLLMKVSITGLLFHEIIGIGISFFIIIHNLLNKNFIINSTKKIFSSEKEVNKKQLIMYILNSALTIGIITISITGILISKYVFTSLRINNTTFLYMIHKISAYITLTLIGLHICIHSKYLINALKNIISNIKTQSVKRAIYLTFAVLFICAIIYTPVSSILSNNTNTKGNNSDIEDGIYGASDETPSLDEFLNSLRCNGCHRSCPLISPRCSVGKQQAQEAISEYNNSNSSSSSSDIYSSEEATEF